MKWASANPAFSMILPLAIFIAWLVLTTTATECGIVWNFIVVAVTVLAGLTILWIYVQERPEVSAEAVADLEPKKD
jgi:hypothetical protein